MMGGFGGFGMILWVVLIGFRASTCYAGVTASGPCAY